MKLFEDNLKSTVAKHENSSDSALLNFWHLNFSERHETYRDYLEDCFNKLGNTDQRKLKAKLLADHKGFYEVLNEIIVGGILVARGWSLQYEPKFGKLTPDWLIQNSENQKAIVDVFTSKTPVHMAKQFDLFSNLEQSLKSLSHNVTLKVDFEDAFLADKHIVEIIDKIEQWLNEKPKIGASFSLKGLVVTLHETQESQQSGVDIWASIDDSKRNDIRDLPNKIIDKVITYENISREYELPFVVAVVFDRMLVDEYTVKQIITTSGFSNIETRYYQNQDGSYYSKKFVPDGHKGLTELEGRFDEGVFRKDFLSGVLGFWFQSRQFSSLQVYKNPKATFALPESLS